MIVVMQCAGRKAHDAGLLLNAARKPVIFFAHPEIATVDDAYVHARPDDDAGDGKSWRDVLLEYNRKGDNSYGLLPAYRLYRNPVYRHLVDKLGIGKVYILSAGWGLITADFLTPYYDITFSPSARGPQAYKRRRNVYKYRDFRMLPEGGDEEIVFLGGQDYLSLFCKLTNDVKGRRKVFYNAAQAPQAPGCETVKLETLTPDELALRVCHCAS